MDNSTLASGPSARRPPLENPSNSSAGRPRRNEVRAAPVPRPTSRRERQRQWTLDEIKVAALEELRSGGVAGVTMRAVARSIELTPSGLYRYVDDHHALIDMLAIDAVTELHARVQDAVDAAQSDHVQACRNGAQEMRAWALEHPHEFGLVWGVRPGDRRSDQVAAEVEQVELLFASTLMSADGSDSLELETIAAEGSGIASGGPDVAAAALLAAIVGNLSVEITSASPDEGADQRFEWVVQGLIRIALAR